MAPRARRRNGFPSNGLISLVLAGCAGVSGPTATVSGSAVSTGPASEPSAPATALVSAMVPDLTRVPLTTMSDPTEPIGAARVVDTGRPPDEEPLPQGAIARVGMNVTNEPRGALSPNGTRLLVQVDGEAAKLVDVRTGKVVRTVGKEADVGSPLHASALSPDGTSAALQLGTENVTLRLVDVATGATKAEAKVGKYSVDAPVFSPDSSVLGFLTDEFDEAQELVVIDVATGKETRHAVAKRGDESWQHLAIAPGGKLAALTRLGDEPAVEIRDLAAGSAVRAWKPRVGVSPIVFSASGDLVAGVGDNSVFAWRTSTGELAFERRLGVTSFLQAGPDDSLWTLAYLDALIALDANGATVRRYRGEGVSASALGFTKDGEVVAYDGSGIDTRAWVRATGQPVVYSGTSTSHAQYVQFSNNGKRVFGLWSDELEDWDVGSGLLTAFRHGSEAAITLAHETSGTIDWVAFEASIRGLGGKLVGTRATAGKTRVIVRTADELWVVEPPSTKPILELSEPHAVAHLLADGSGILVGGYGEPYSVRDIPSGKTRVTLEDGAQLAMTDAIGSPDGKVVFGRRDSANVVTVYSATTGKPVGEMPTEGSYAHVEDFAVSPDGRWVIGGCSNNVARIWNAATYAPVVDVRGHSDMVTGVAFSPDGARFATASRDGTLVVWETARLVR